MRHVMSVAMRSAVVALALIALAHRADAQDPFTAAKKAAQKAANAASAHVEAEQHPEATTPQKGAAQKNAPQEAAPQKAAPQKAAPPAAPGPKATPSSTKPGAQLNVAKADTMTIPTILYREAYEYSRDGRRDPFVSLLTTNELRPALSDLKLSNIIYDASGRHSVAIMRDLTNNTQYRVTAGSALGRMRVTAIHVLSVVFTIEEFGTSRLDSLVLRDTTKRGR
ncbi:MAG TPA: hypothetical protein VN706_22770 [Gemmatimonadaceae bacterium]|nr:hypothetical protein [Gemmatimonadaceae bacterium]